MGVLKAKAKVKPPWKSSGLTVGNERKIKATWVSQKQNIPIAHMLAELKVGFVETLGSIETLHVEVKMVEIQFLRRPSTPGHSLLEVAAVDLTSLQVLINGIFVNWESPEKPVSENPTYQELDKSA